MCSNQIEVMEFVLFHMTLALEGWQIVSKNGKNGG